MAVGSAVSEREVALGANRPNPKRGAFVVAAAAVLLVGGGLIVGTGSGNEGENQVSPTPSTTAVRPTTTDRPTRTTVNRTTTSPTVPTYTAAPMTELGAQPLYAIVNYRVLRIDTATGQSVILGEGSRDVGRGSGLVPRAGGVVLWGDAAWFYPDDGSPPVSLGFGEVWPAGDPALLWVRDYTSNNVEQIRLIRVATGEEVARPTLPVFSYPLGDDGTGRLLVGSQTGGAFTIDIATGVATRVSDTSVVAATASHLLLLRCDDALVCGHELVDRATGEVEAVPIAVASGYGDYALDPTGASVVVLEYDYEGTPVTRLVELNTGAEVELDMDDTRYTGYRAAPVSWTADGQHLVGPRDSAIAVWTAGSGESAEYRVTDVDGDEATVTAAAVGF